MVDIMEELEGAKPEKEAKMDHHAKPLIRSQVLVVMGALFVSLITLFGVLNNPGELIKQDVTMGPIVAAGRIVVPLIIVVGVLYFFANLRKCESCGKILFWKKNRN
ncbi:hypothetical protein [Candidatus Magnetaquicoccus inordinatus]|uniref:hypothetical protein n=1 Tax=Candidatus Magnetaquicoccus inordinatus TaxID=2496818 RepID=UPI00102B8B87|nr:hypothetical protein [Candidatus Magnetaquicoccus inordinatus]